MSDRNDPGDAMGRLEAWWPDRAIASGLERIAQGAVVDIEGGGRALVTALCRDHVELAPLSIVEPARHAVVRAIGPLACLGSAHLREYETTLWHAASYDPRQRAALSEALRVRACLRLRPDVIDSAEQVVCLLAICQLTDLPEPVVEPFLVAYLTELRGSCAA